MKLETYLINSGDVYNGQWKEGQRFGKGLIFHKEGGYYEGSWKNDKPNGKGRLIYEDGT